MQTIKQIIHCTCGLLFSPICVYHWWRTCRHVLLSRWNVFYRSLGAKEHFGQKKLRLGQILHQKLLRDVWNSVCSMILWHSVSIAYLPCRICCRIWPFSFTWVCGCPIFFFELIWNRHVTECREQCTSPSDASYLLTTTVSVEHAYLQCRNTVLHD